MKKRAVSFTICLLFLVACCGTLGCSSEYKGSRFVRIFDWATGKEYWVGQYSDIKSKKIFYIPYDGLVHRFEWSEVWPGSEGSVYACYPGAFTRGESPLRMNIPVYSNGKRSTCEVRMQIIDPQEPIPELTFAPTGIVEELSRDQKLYTYKYDGQEHCPECYAEVDGERIELKKSAIKAIRYKHKESIYGIGNVEWVGAVDWPKDVGTYSFLYFVDEYENAEPNQYAPASKWVRIEIIE